MTPERLQTLLDAYGADPRRWPRAEQESARELLARAPLQWHHATAEAELLDRWLSSHVVAAPDPAFAQRALTGRVALRRGPAGRWRQLRGWWAGGGLIGVALAGTVAGAGAMTIALRLAPQGAPDALDQVTAFSAAPVDWSDE